MLVRQVELSHGREAIVAHLVVGGLGLNDFNWGAHLLQLERACLGVLLSFLHYEVLDRHKLYLELFAVQFELEEFDTNFELAIWCRGCTHCVV